MRKSTVVFLFLAALIAGCSGPSADQFVVTTGGASSQGAGGGGGGGDCGGGLLDAVFSNASGNAFTTAVSTTFVQGTFAEIQVPVDPPIDGSTFTVQSSLCPVPTIDNRIINRTVSFTATDTTPALRPRSFAVGFDQSTNTSHTLDYTESIFDLGTGTLTERGWTAQSGTITLASIDGAAMTFAASGVMVPRQVNGEILATGTFNLDVTARVDAMTRL